MKRLLTIGEAAEALGVTTTTLRNWDKSGVLHPDERTRGETADIGLSHCVTSNHRQASQRIEKPIACARVSSHDQKQDLVRQVQVLENYCSSKGFQYEIIQDLGSGMNYYKKA